MTKLHEALTGLCEANDKLEFVLQRKEDISFIAKLLLEKGASEIYVFAKNFDEVFFGKDMANSYKDFFTQRKFALSKPKLIIILPLGTFIKPAYLDEFQDQVVIFNIENHKLGRENNNHFSSYMTTSNKGIIAHDMIMGKPLAYVCFNSEKALDIIKQIKDLI